MVVYVYSDRYLSFRKQYVKNSSCINKICNFCKSQSTQALKSRDPRKDKKIDEKKSLLEALKIKKISSFNSAFDKFSFNSQYSV